ncbi:MAG: hypothetical protein AAB428_02945 [Patescibacteria group bacterium]
MDSKEEKPVPKEKVRLTDEQNKKLDSTKNRSRRFFVFYFA